MYIQCVFSQDTNCIYLKLDSSNCYLLEKFNKPILSLEKKWESENKVLTHQSPTIADMDNDCIPEIITFSENLSFTTNEIVILDSRTGKVKIKFLTLKLPDDGNPNLLVADINNDGIMEILFCTSTINLFPNDSKIVCYNSKGQRLWISNERYHKVIRGNQDPTLGVSDFNQDGLPEIYVYNQIFNAQTGVLLVDGDDKDGIGGNDLTMAISHQVSVAAQLDQDLTNIELAAGFSIYKVRIINLNGKVGNTITPLNLQVNGQYLDGRTCVADMNQDGQIDVVVAHSDEFGAHILYVYSLINNIPSLLASYNNFPNLLHIGTPTIADIDGDRRPNILITKNDAIDCYEYNNKAALDLKWSIKIDDGDSYSAVSTFDLNADGIPELIHRGDSLLYIIDGSVIPPKIINSKSCFSLTTNENCTIADIDNSGTSKICITCNPEITRYSLISKLTVFGPPDGQEWAPAHPIWNQYAYNPLYINDDLTVPQYPKSQATYMNGKYNNFMQQESLLDSNGMYKVAAASLLGDMTCINYDPLKDEYVITFSVINKKEASRSSGDRWHVTFYDGNPENGGVVIDSIQMTKGLKPGDTLHDLTFTFKRFGINQLFMVVNTSRSSGGIFNDKDFKILECDYTDNISSWIDFPIFSIVEGRICESKTYTYMDSIYDKAGKFYYFKRDANGCDKEIAIIDIVKQDTFINELFYSSCDSIRVMDSLFTSSGDRVISLSSVNGCDSTVIAHVDIKKSSSNLSSLAVCDSLIWNGRKLNTSGRYTFQTNNSSGCDSVVILDLTVNRSRQVEINYTNCGPYSWNGSTYSTSGDYAYQTSTLNGCDSTITLHLTIDNVIRNNVNVSSCIQYNWNGRLLTQDGIYVDTLTGVQGCDSIVSLDLKINTPTQSTSTLRICDSIQWNGNMYNQSGAYSFKTLNSKGCDSTAILDLIINKSNNSQQDISACNSFAWNGNTYTQSGSYQFKTSTTYGCDSIANLKLIILPSSKVSMNQIACDNYLWNGKVITQSGIFIDTSKNQLGCDSITQLNLTINTSSTSNQSITACDSINFLNKVYKQSGTYVVKTMNSTGCDSTINLSLSLNSQRNTLKASSCDSYIWNNQSYTQTGIYENKSINRFGCDSIEELQLTIHPSYHRSDSSSTCDSYQWIDGIFYNKSGRYTKQYNSQFGCDSTFTLALNINPSFYKADTVYSSSTYTWPVNSTNYNNSGTYNSNYKTQQGCDSLFTLLLIIEEEKIEIYAPNIINTNSIDGNNKFTLYDNGRPVKIHNLSIYDRWGGLLWSRDNFESGKPNEGWDGSSKIKNVNPGVYVWVATIQLANGGNKTIQGDVTLIK